MPLFSTRPTPASTFHKLVSDPFAPEEQWLPVCADIDEDGSRLSNLSNLSKPSKFRARCWRFGALPLAILASCYTTWVFAGVVDFGYDLGYRMMPLFLPLTNSLQQGVMALNSLAFVVGPLIFGFSFGSFKNAYRGSHKIWNRAGLVLILTYAVFMAYISLDHDFRGIDILRSIAWVAAAVGSYKLAMTAGERFYGFVKSRMRAARVLLPAVATLTPVVLLSMRLQARESSNSMSVLGYEAVLYFAGISFTAFVAAGLTKAHGRLGSILVGCLSVLPLIACNLLNVGGNLLSFCLDQIGIGASLGLSALGSAIFLTGTLLIATVVGSLLGSMFRQATVSGASCLTVKTFPKGF